MENVEEPRSKPGPEPDQLKLDADWEQAVKEAVQKPKPPAGWPERPATPRRKRRRRRAGK